MIIASIPWIKIQSCLVQDELEERLVSHAR
jgi:hypothetical protein